MTQRDAGIKMMLGFVQYASQSLALSDMIGRRLGG